MIKSTNECSAMLNITLGMQDLIFVSYKRPPNAQCIDPDALIQKYIQREGINYIWDDFIPVSIYQAPEDSITVPVNSMFKDKFRNYDQFQALINSTGHPDRLNRFNLFEPIYSDTNYIEELVSQFGGMILNVLTSKNNLLPIRIDKVDSRLKYNASKIVSEVVEFAEAAVNFILEKGGSND